MSPPTSTTGRCGQAAAHDDEAYDDGYDDAKEEASNGYSHSETDIDFCREGGDTEHCYVVACTYRLSAKGLGMRLGGYMHNK